MAVDRLGEGAEIRTEEGSFFGRDGTERSGTIYRVGNIATFGVSPTESGALLPVGEGRLQAWREGGEATGAALAAGTADARMGLYLHEGRTKRIEEREPKTVSDILEAGGTVGYVILACGALALVLMVLRVIGLSAAGAGASAVDAAVKAVSEGRLADAAKAVETAKGSPARVVARLTQNLDLPRNSLEDVASEALLQETPRVERFGSAILVIAAVRRCSASSAPSPA